MTMTMTKNQYRYAEVQRYKSIIYATAMSTMSTYMAPRTLTALLFICSMSHTFFDWNSLKATGVSDDLNQSLTLRMELMRPQAACLLNEAAHNIELWQLELPPLMHLPESVHSASERMLICCRIVISLDAPVDSLSKTDETRFSDHLSRPGTKTVSTGTSSQALPVDCRTASQTSSVCHGWPWHNPPESLWDSHDVSPRSRGTLSAVER